MAKIASVTCGDGAVFQAAEARCVGSVAKVRSHDIHTPAKVGEFPVLVEQSGAYRMFSYSRKITAIELEAAPVEPDWVELAAPLPAEDKPAQLSLFGEG